MKTNASNINIKNKRASFDYEFIDTYTAGIVLTGYRNQVYPSGQGEPGRYVLFLFARRVVGEEHAHRRILLRFVQQSCGTARPQAPAYEERASQAGTHFGRAGIHYRAYPYVYQREGAGKGGHRPCQRKEAIRQAPEPEGERRQADDGPDV